MPPALEIGFEKNVQAVLGDFFTDHASTKTNDVGVVMQSAHPRTQSIVDQGCANLGMAVRGYADSDTAAADQDASICLVFTQGMGKSKSKIRIINRFFGVCSKVDYMMTRPY